VFSLLVLSPHYIPTMDFLDTISEKSAWTVTALGFGTVLTLGGYIYSKYSVRHAFRKYTAVDHLSVLGRERKGAKLKGTVVVAGGRYVGHSHIPKDPDAMFSRLVSQDSTPHLPVSRNLKMLWSSNLMKEPPKNAKPRHEKDLTDLK
jgi:hypothetical protein